MTANAKREKSLTAHPLNNNEELWNFAVKSRDVFWNKYVQIPQARGETRFLGPDYDSLQTVGTVVNAKTSKREVLVCHDMMGNYREDIYFGTSKKWDDYRFYHWSGINYFCYFSHNYITIPPASWINAAHKHGVPVLGTFITESDENLREVLESAENVERTVDALVKLCEHFCFEGYLLNIECRVDTEQIANLESFVAMLTDRIHRNIPKGVVFWYDSVDSNGKLDWKNELNKSNQCYLCACDGILINYNWNDKHLETTKATIDDLKSKPTKVFMGLDVFARGQVAEMESHKTLSRIVPYNFSVNIFAPGWTFESLHKKPGIDLNKKHGDEALNEMFLEQNNQFWSLLWNHLLTIAYTRLPFYTDFCVGSGKYTFNLTEKENCKFFDLSKQSLQPSVPIFNRAKHFFDDAVNGGSCLQILQPNKGFRLFVTDFVVEKTVVFGFASKGKNSSPLIDCLLEIRGVDTVGSCEIVCGNYPSYMAKKGLIFMPRIRSNNTYKITKFLSEMNENLRLPYSLPNGWIVQYFILSFDQRVKIEDIGVFWRAEIEPDANYLGAIYLHAGNLNVEGINEIHIQDYFTN